MPISLICPGCGGSVKAPDHAAGKTGKCPKCGQAVAIPATASVESGFGFADPAPAAAEPEFLPVSPVMNPPRMPVSPNGKDRVISVVVGKPASAWAGAAVPATFGRTTLQLTDTRLIERTRRPIIARDCYIPLSSIDSAEIETKGNPLLIALGFLTIGIFGFGLLLIILYFFLKHKFLIIRSGHNAVLVTIKGSEAQYQQFLESVLAASDLAKRSG